MNMNKRKVPAGESNSPFKTMGSWEFQGLLPQILTQRLMANGARQRKRTVVGGATKRRTRSFSEIPCDSGVTAKYPRLFNRVRLGETVGAKAPCGPRRSAAIQDAKIHDLQVARLPASTGGTGGSSGAGLVAIFESPLSRSGCGRLGWKAMAPVGRQLRAATGGLPQLICCHAQHFKDHAMQMATRGWFEAKRRGDKT